MAQLAAKTYKKIWVIACAKYSLRMGGKFHAKLEAEEEKRMGPLDSGQNMSVNVDERQSTLSDQSCCHEKQNLQQWPG